MQTLKSLVLFLFLLAACRSKLQDDGKTYHDTYLVAEIPGIDTFKTMNQKEIELEKAFLENDSDSKKSNGSYEDYLKNNRCRVFMDSDSSHKLFSADHFENGVSFPCYCTLNHDTLDISMVVGLFGGYGFRVKAHDNKFTSLFLTYAVHGKYFKSNLNDTAFSEEADAKSQFQYLVFEEAPTYKPGQQLTGYFTMTSNRFYELGVGNALDSTYASARIFFTCRTSPGNPLTFLVPLSGKF